MSEDLIADGGLLEAPQEDGSTSTVHIFLQEGVWTPSINERELKRAASIYLEIGETTESDVDDEEPFLHIEYGKSESKSYEYIGFTEDPYLFLDRFEHLADLSGYDQEDIRYRLD